MFTLHHGRCDGPGGLETLEARSVDHVITDPPYSPRVHTDHGLKQKPDGGSGYATIDFNPIDGKLMDYTAAQLARIVRRWVVLFTDIESVHLWTDAIRSAGLEVIRTMVWIKVSPMPQITGDRPAPGFEAMILAHRTGPKRWHGGGKAGVYTFPVCALGETRTHPTQKPLVLMEALVRDFTDRGETILDPFAGSGTTGVAALRHGRHFIGWEMDAKYHRVATERMNMTREQGDLFTGIPKVEKQNRLFVGVGG